MKLHNTWTNPFSKRIYHSGSVYLQISLLYSASLDEPLPKVRHHLAVGDLVVQTKPQEPHEVHPIQYLVLRLLVNPCSS